MKIKYISCFGVILLLSLLFSSCFTVPEYRGASNFKLEEFKDRNLAFKLNLDIYNPNSYGIKVRKSKLDVYVNESYIGEATLRKSLKMKRKSSTSCLLPVNLKLEKGAAFKLIPVLNLRKGAKIRVEGVLKASALLIPKRERINEEININLKDLGIDFKNFLN